MLREHLINPVNYIEFENTSADKSLREVVGHDGRPDFLDSNAEARTDKEREIELKLILGQQFSRLEPQRELHRGRNSAAEPGNLATRWPPAGL